MARKKQSAPKVITGAFNERPAPPPDLTPAQAEIWKATVASEPIEWFQSAANRDLLALYCCVVNDAKVYQSYLNAIPEALLSTTGGSMQFKRISQMKRDAVKEVASLSVKLRLCNSARYDRSKAASATKNGSADAKPWESTG